MHIIAGDIGATHTRLGLFDLSGELLARQIITNADQLTLWPLIQAFIRDHQARPSVACLGVAAPVFEQRARMTNLAWTLDARELSQRLGAPLTLVNDLYAQALAVTQLKAGDYFGLDDQAPRPGAPMVILGAGTGLGTAALLPPSAQLNEWQVVSGEGGHMRFAPRDETGVGLWRALSTRYGPHISVERVVSGQGLVDAYDFLRQQTPRWPELEGEHPPAVVIRRALADTCPASRRALEHFVDTYADVAADLSLALNAGAVWLLGGITSRILPVLRPRFRNAFENKGRYRAQLEQVPVRVVTYTDPGLLGARLIAQRQLAQP